MIQAPSQVSWLHHVTKGVAVAASTGAAVVSILTALYSYGVVGKSESHQSLGNHGAAWVRLRPAADTATAIGDTLRFAATVGDKRGSILVGATPVWTTGDSSIATVAADGSVIARGVGTTTLNVVVGTVVTSARILVRPLVATVVIAHEGADTALTVLEQGTVQLRAVPLDARGHAVAGRDPEWRSDDTSVAAIDPHGLLVARSAGRSVVAVKVDNVSASIPLDVALAASNLSVVAGAAQHALAGHPLAQQVVVRATNRRGAPAAGKQVTFELDPGAGRAEPATAVTDADGRARTQWTLGELPGAQSLRARVENVDSAVVASAEAEPVAANTRVVAVQAALRARAGTELGDSVAVKLTDSLARPLAGVPVTWVATAGELASPVTRTDSAGVARARWTLANRVGTQRLRAFVGGAESRIAPVSIDASALSGPPAHLTVVQGDAQRGTAGQALAHDVVIRVTDAAGNAAAGVSVVLAPSAGALRDSVVTTDSSGKASVRWHLGHSAGEQRLAARVDGIAAPLRVIAHASAAPAANLSFDDAPSAAGKQKGMKRLVALVADVYGNPVAEAPVSFVTKSGTVTPSRAVTDAHGQVLVTWKAAGKADEQRLSGMVRGTRVSGAYIAQRVATRE